MTTRASVSLVFLLPWIFVLSSASSAQSELRDCVIEQYRSPHPPMVTAPDPSSKGDYTFSVLRYGGAPSLFSFRKPDIVSAEIDLPLFLRDFSREMQFSDSAYHNFDSEALELKAKVWMPDRAGPSPLVLIAHGNSKPGFDYLGELLASRGYIVAQIDQSYLNGLQGENGARAWILLEHLRQWRVWNENSHHKFFKKVDMDKVALIGMSRGGEAVALAASFNTWKTLQGNDKLLGNDFNIRAVIALAPMDGQYEHAHGENILVNTNYLALQGGHDADVYQFLGSRQWNRINFDQDGDFRKQLVYFYLGNHINFNQRMSNAFYWGTRGSFDKTLLTPTEQEMVTVIFASAFLELTIHERREYTELFNRPVSGLFGLPNDIYLPRYKTSRFEMIENFESEMDMVQLIEGGVVKDHLELKRGIVSERLRGGLELSNKVLRLDLKQGQETRLKFQIPTPILDSSKYQNEVRFQFSLARSDSTSTRLCHPYDLLAESRIEIIDDSLILYSAPLNQSGTLSPVLLSDYSELKGNSVRYAQTEALLQTYSVNLNKLDSSHLNENKYLEFHIIFTPSSDAAVIIDDFGVEK